MNKITKENIKDYVQLISKKLRTEWTSDFVPTYYYDYKIKFYESNKKNKFCIEISDLEKDFKDVDYNLIFHYVNKFK
tara:strand:- start:224 stop:454 length:231 start_codon:yes stop_codon:yes gene_type:complete